MLEFCPLTPQNAHEIKPYLSAATDRVCNFTAGTLLLWRAFSGTSYAVRQGSLFLRAQYADGKTFYALPLGGCVSEAFQVLSGYAASENLPLALYPVTESGIAFLESLGVPMRQEERRDLFDYLYDAPALAEFTGKAYHGQRNHVNRFQKTHPDWSFAPAESQERDEIAAFFDRFAQDRPPSNVIGAEELRRTAELFRDPDFFGMLTGVLRVGGEIAAVSAGEVSGDTLFVHVEKADIRFPGVYPMMVQTFARAYVSGGVLYINREEDDGRPGLRQAKLSYHPVRLLPKWMVYL